MSQQQPDTSDWNSISALAGCILDVVVRIIPFDHAWWQTPRVSCGQKRANHIRLGGLSADQMAHLRAHNPAEYTRACEVLSELYCSNVAINPSFDLPRYWCKGNLPKKRLAEVELIRTLYDLLAIVLPVPPVADIHRTRANMPQPDPSSPSAPRRLPVQPFLQLWSVHTPSASSDQGGAAPYLAGGAGGSRGGWKTLLDEVLMHKFVCRNGLPWIQCARTHTPPTAASQPPVCTSGFSSLGHTYRHGRPLSWCRLAVHVVFGAIHHVEYQPEALDYTGIDFGALPLGSSLASGQPASSPRVPPRPMRDCSVRR